MHEPRNVLASAAHQIPVFFLILQTLQLKHDVPAGISQTFLYCSRVVFANRTSRQATVDIQLDGMDGTSEREQRV